uniref:Receptor-type tyrosine-protein phosphatase U-like Fn3 domain-containing protein n=1 Tax=Plectus sambesii TaxID=2011161 RepID=A0A914VX13_9BILA
VEEVWNKWVTAARRPWTPSDLHCSVIPPQHHIDNIGVAELYRNVTLHPSSKDKDAWRYFIVVDMRLNPVDFETADLEDKMTATAKNMPYYITAALVPSTVKDGQTFSIGDGRVHGGYLNYPLKKEDEFTWKLVAAQVSQVSSKKSHEHNIPQSCHLLEDGTLKCEPHHWLAAIPWWYILLALLLLIFSILCTLCLACVLWNLRRKSYNVRAEAAQDSSRQPLNRPDSEAA